MKDSANTTSGEAVNREGEARVIQELLEGTPKVLWFIFAVVLVIFVLFMAAAGISYLPSGSLPPCIGSFQALLQSLLS